MWRTIAQMFWAFKVEHAVDADDNLIRIDSDTYPVDLVAAPLPFVASIVPRSEAQAQVVREAASDRIDFLKQWEQVLFVLEGIHF
jgi:hypothetical protein